MPIGRGPSCDHIPNSFVISCGSSDPYWRCKTPINEEKTRDCQPCAEGNPINIATGRKFHIETDFGTGIVFKRHYSSRPYFGGNGRVGTMRKVGWSHSFNLQVAPYGNLQENVEVLRWDRRVYTFYRPDTGNVWTRVPDVNDVLTELKDGAGVRTGWKYYDADTENIELYNPAGQLQSITTRAGVVQTMGYNSSNQLVSVTDSFGRTLTFTYYSAVTTNGANDLATATDNDGNTISYSYDSENRLSSVSFPGGASKTYLYNEPLNTGGANLPLALTGIIDENGARNATYKYDTLGRAVSTEHAGGVDKYSISYDQTMDNVQLYAFSTVTDPLGTARTYRFDSALGVPRQNTLTLPCPHCKSGNFGGMGYDVNGNVSVTSDFNGKIGCAAFDTTRNLQTRKVDGLNYNEPCMFYLATPPVRADVRVVDTTWHATYRLPMSITEPAAPATVGGSAGSKLTEFTYDTAGNMLTRKVTAPKNDGSGTNAIRTWIYTYNSLGQVLTAKDPLNRTTTTVYYTATDTAVPPKYTQGDIQTVTNAAGHVTTFNEYDRVGRVRKMTDPNGLVTTLSYHPRGWLQSRAVTNATTTETTSYAYDDVGQLTRVTLPDGSTLYYAYDDAHRLVGMSDQATGTVVSPTGGLRVQLANLAGNRVVYTLDNMGNRVREDHYDPSATLSKRKQRAIDSINRLKQDIAGTDYATAAPSGAAAVDPGVSSPPLNAAVTQYSYDGNGNLTSTLDPLGRETINGYDFLNRLWYVIDPQNGGSKPTIYGHSQSGNLETVTDPQGLVTSYVYNGHGELITQTSPDTGVSKFTYNAMGNVVTKFDAENRCSLTTYDTLHRVTAVRYFASSNANTNTAAGCAAATTSTTTVAETVSYSYDSITATLGGPGGKGRLSRVSDAGGRVDYIYDMNGRITSKAQVTTGATNATKTVKYAYNSAGQLSSMTTPSGQTITYVYGSSVSASPGKLIGIKLGTTPQIDIVKGGVYEPFGPNGGWSWGNHNGSSVINQHLRVFDLDYRPTAIGSDTEGYNRNIEWDRGNRILSIKVPSITIPGVTNAMSVNQAYQYDALDRLTEMTPGVPGSRTQPGVPGLLPAEAFTYDAIGNRLSRIAIPPGGSAATATYDYPNLPGTPGTKRHTLTGITGAQVNAYAYDLTGNTITESAALGTAINPTGTASLAHTYDARNRLKTVQVGSTAADTVTYKINGLGQRYQKVGAGQFVYSTSTTVNTSTGLSPQSASIPYNARYVYDEQGRLLGEYSPEGKLIQETIWLDDLPVATLRPKGASVQLPLGIAGTGASTANNTGSNTPTNPANVDVFYVHPDHLGTPRVATRSTAVGGATTGPNAINKAVWRWDSDPFGTSLDNSKPVENPQLVTGTASQVTAASFRVSNRFPGQQFDIESGKQYNYFRDYDSSIGRYVESDPIGLSGGFNTFGYARQRPSFAIDPFGLADYLPPNPNYPTSVVVCRGGYPSPQLQRLSPVYQKCIGHCLYEHELLHVDDLMSSGFASICKGKPDGTILMVDVVFNAESEARARQLEIDCLRRSMSRRPYCDECTPIIQSRLSALGAR